MGGVDAQVLSSLFLLPETIAIDGVYPTMTHLTIQVRCVLKSASCPLCQHPSERIHGSYGRTVADVPCGGRRVTLALTVRKFVCRTPDCPRKIFTERLPALVQSYARMTNRLSEALQSLGFATCGEVGERFAPKLGCVSRVQRSCGGCEPIPTPRLRPCVFWASTTGLGKKVRPTAPSWSTWKLAARSNCFQIVRPKRWKLGYGRTRK
jgi:hypothetical protein